MAKNIPPQIVLLSIIAEHKEGITINDIAAHVEKLKDRGIELGYTFTTKYGKAVPRELLLDINMLKVLGLVDEVNGRYVVTDKGYALLSKFQHVFHNMQLK